MISKLKARCCEKNKYLFRFGDKGDAYFMVLKGSLSVTIPKDIKKTREVMKKIE